MTASSEVRSSREAYFEMSAKKPRWPAKRSMSSAERSGRKLSNLPSQASVSVHRSGPVKQLAARQVTLLDRAAARDHMPARSVRVLVPATRSVRGRRVRAVAECPSGTTADTGSVAGVPRTL